jgi:hypothetical protein
MKVGFYGLDLYNLSTSVEPIERTARWEAGEVPETYPSGL